MPPHSSPVYITCAILPTLNHPDTTPMMLTRIFIVEDEPILALDIKETLQEAGYAIVGISSNAEEALQFCRTLNPQLVLMDIKLEGTMTGIDAAQRINSELDIPVVFLTSYVDKATLDNAYKASPYGYLLKPYRTETLIMTLQLALDHHTKQRQMAMDIATLREQQAQAETRQYQLSASTSYQLFSGILIRDGAPVKLTTKEKVFLDLLANHAGKMVDFERIQREIWNTPAGRIQPLRALVHRLRQKAGGGMAIESVHESGYRLNTANLKYN